MYIDNPPNQVFVEIGDIEQRDPEVDPLLGHGPLLSRPDIGSPEEEHSLEQLGEGGQLPSCSITDENHLQHLANDLVQLSESYIERQERESLETKKKLNTRFLIAIDEICTFKGAEKKLQILLSLLNEGANPNATCHDGKLTACHIASQASGAVLSFLIINNAEKFRVDDLGRTPLHMAALGGKVRNIALLLDFPEEMIDRIENDNISSEDLKEYCERDGDLVGKYLTNSREMSLPDSWLDHSDHECKKMDGTISCYKELSENWTPLHGAAAQMYKQSVRLLLAAGADPNLCDGKGRTALDVVGLLEGDITHLTGVVDMILNAGGLHNTMRRGGVNEVSTPLHTAVWIDNRRVVERLLKNGASLACWDEHGRTPLHVCVQLQREEILSSLIRKAPDVQDSDGKTVLRAAVDAGWHRGVRLAVEAGADPTIRAHDGETPVHIAAMSDDTIGNFFDLPIFIIFGSTQPVVNCLNNKGETPLFNAVNCGCTKNQVDNLLAVGASIKHNSKNNLSVFHVAAKKGSENVLKRLLDFDKDSTNLMINSLTTLEGYGPIHFAVSRNHLSCVKLLIERNADICLRTSNLHGSITPLHIAAINDNTEIAEYILSCNEMSPTPSMAQQHSAPRPIDQVDEKGWLPLHYAIHNDSKEVIKLLLKKEPILAALVPKEIDGSEESKTVLDMIMHNVSKPTEFLENILDSYISLDGKANRVKIDYQILMPDRDRMTQMNVIEALIKTGNYYEQKKLLLHPLIESYIDLKWKTAKPYYILMASIYTCFVISLTSFSASFFYHKDTYQTKPKWSNLGAGGCVTYLFNFIIILLEILMNRSFLKRENWVKLGSLGSAILLPPAIMVQEEAARHVATGALFLAYAQVMIIFSQYPNWGYNVVMFGKVASNVIKIMGTFIFLLIAFALSFMIQFRSQTPFDGPWDAFVKTLFLWSSEFGYDDLFDAQHAKDLGFSFQVVRVIFVAFLILAPIALMNMVICVAFDDISDIRSHSHIRSLEKQVAFMSSLGALLEFNLKQKVLSCFPVRYFRQFFSRKIVLESDTVKLKTVYNIREMPKRFWKAFYIKAEDP